MTWLEEGPSVEYVSAPNSVTWAAGEPMRVNWPASIDHNTIVIVHDDVVVNTTRGTTRRISREHLELP